MHGATKKVSLLSLNPNTVRLQILGLAKDRRRYSENDGVGSQDKSLVTYLGLENEHRY